MNPYLLTTLIIYAVIGFTMALITNYMHRRTNMPTDAWAMTIVTVMCLLFWPLFFIRRK